MQLPDDIARFDDAQRRAIAMLGDVARRLEEGMSERDVFELAETRLQDHGFTGWYHGPEIAVGAATARARHLPFPPSSRRKLVPGGLITIDLAPGGADAYGDVGVTFVFGGGTTPVVDEARRCVRGCCGFASRWKTCGEIYVFAKAWAVNHRMELVNARAVGHRVLGREGLASSGFPRSAHLLTLLPRNQLHRLNPVRMAGLFAIRPQLRQGDQGAAFEEMIWIHDDARRVLGRDSADEIGTF